MLPIFYAAPNMQAGGEIAQSSIGAAGFLSCVRLFRFPYVQKSGSVLEDPRLRKEARIAQRKEKGAGAKAARFIE